jgi:hypothetical protein
VAYTFTPPFTTWQVTATPPRFSSTVSTSGSNPTLTLYSGWHYVAMNSGFAFHPLELLVFGANAASDTTLLSQATSTTGSLEGDSSIGWTEVSGESHFTVSPSLQAQLTGYRCGVHTTMMRAPIVIQTR